MTNNLARTVAIGLISMWAAAPLGAQAEKNAPTVAGKWTMTLQGGPHGATTMGLTLEGAGRKITGTFATPHGDMAVKGEFADGTLTLATVEGGEQEITFNAKLTADDTLSGYLSSAKGDMTWTATRVKDSR